MLEGDYEFSVKHNGEEIDSFSIQLVSELVPDWIRNNAGWWAEGAIDDTAFVQGIQFLIQENILVISGQPQSQNTSDEGIPDWIRNNAGWWAERLIGDSDFVGGLQYMIEHGIIDVTSRVYGPGDAHYGTSATRADEYERGYGFKAEP